MVGFGRKLTKRDIIIRNRVRELASKKGMLYKETQRRGLSKVAMPGGRFVRRAVKGGSKRGSRTMDLGNAYSRNPKKTSFDLGRVGTGIAIGGMGAGAYALMN